METLINGRAYDFTQVVARINGYEVASVTAVNYKEEQAKTNNYGAGTRPVSRGHGAIEVSSSIGMSMNDVENIRDTAPDGSLLKIAAFDVQISYLNAGKVVTHTLKNCEFTDDGVEASQGDTDISMTFNLIPSHILYR